MSQPPAANPGGKADDASSVEDLHALVAGRSWYHTIELAPGLQTPGWFDLRAVAPQVLPGSLEAKRCLDVAAFDGFWSLEMRARGASEVVAIDVLDPDGWDWPLGSGPDAIEAIGDRKGHGEGYEVVMRALRRDSMERHDLSVYDLSPERVGRFDFVYVGSLLLHLRDPIRALERVRSVCAGEMVLVDNFDPYLTWLHPRRPIATLDGEGRPWWWRANLAGLVQMVRSSGFTPSGKARRITMTAGAGQSTPPMNLTSVRSRAIRTAYRNARWGDPHAVIRARPTPI